MQELQKIMVFSDIHAKEDQISKVLRAYKNSDCQELWCLGDLVGYGHQPQSVVEKVRLNVDFCLAGNHDFAASGRLSWFMRVLPPWLKKTLRQAQEELSEENMKWLKSLPAENERYSIECFHGSRRDPVMEFLSESNALMAHLMYQKGLLSLVGHTHMPLAAGVKDDQFLIYSPKENEKLDLSQADHWVLNPGTSGLKNSENSVIRTSTYLILEFKDNIPSFATWKTL